MFRILCRLFVKGNWWFTKCIAYEAIDRGFRYRNFEIKSKGMSASRNLGMSASALYLVHTDALCAVYTSM